MSVNPETNDQLGYLDHYRTLESPGFAVLVRGAWGVGKTYQVKAKLCNDHHYYISLFGLSQTQQIFANLLGQMSRTANTLSIFRKATGALGIGCRGVSVTAPTTLLDSAIEASLFKILSPNKVLVFDDLERSSISFKELWGVVNRFVEHKQCKVVIVCHDGELEENFESQSEKILGYEIEVVPNFNQAFDCFLSKFETDSRNVIEPHKDLINEVFVESEVCSLRVLRMVLYDLERLFQCFPLRYFENDEAIESVLRFFLIFAFAYRAKFISAEDIKNRHQQTWHFDNTNKNSKDIDVKNRPPIVCLRDRHPNAKLFLEIIEPQVLINMLKLGIYECKTLIDWLNQVLFPPSIEEWPAWRKFLEFDGLDDAESDKIIQELDQQFESKSVSDLGELLHIFAIRLLLIKIIPERGTLESEVQSCKHYLDYVTENVPAAFEKINDDWFDGFHQSHGGFTFFVPDATKPYFGEITDHLKRKKEEAFRANTPS